MELKLQSVILRREIDWIKSWNLPEQPMPLSEDAVNAYCIPPSVPSVVVRVRPGLNSTGSSALDQAIADIVVKYWRSIFADAMAQLEQKAIELATLDCGELCSAFLAVEQIVENQTTEGEANGTIPADD